MPSLKYTQTHHMKTPAEFERCYARKRSASDGLLIVYACENERPHPRLGCSVSRKVGNAVVRNRYKRLFREAFRLTQHDLPPGVDLILIPRPGPYPAIEPLKASLVKLARQAARKLSEGNRSNPPPGPLPAGRGSKAPAESARKSSALSEAAELPLPGPARSLARSGRAEPIERASEERGPGGGSAPEAPK